MNRDELIEHQREEIKALKAANLDMQIHFDIMKAELEGVNSLYIVIPEREDCEDDRKHPNSWTVTMLSDGRLVGVKRSV